MPPLHAQVRHGRLVLDEPTDLPEGQVVELLLAEEVRARDGDTFDDEERERLLASLRAGLRQSQAGETLPLEEALAELRK